MEMLVTLVGKNLKKKLLKETISINCIMKRKQNIAEKMSTTSETNNQKISRLFLLLADQYFYSGQSALKFKASALKSAAKKIVNCPTEITSASIAIQKAGISERIGKRIQEILETGGLTELAGSGSVVWTAGSGAAGSGAAGSGSAGSGAGSAVLEVDFETTAIKALTQITGIGPKKAKIYYDQGIYNISDLRKACQDGKIKLTHHIEVGVRWYEDLLLRMPREEASALDVILQKVIKKMNPDLILTICGSYRRGKLDCGDIDVLITNPKKPNEELAPYGYLKNFVKKLQEIGFIVGDLTTEGDKKYMGVCKLNADGRGRRIDIRCVDYVSYYAALIYFTGSKDFNIDVRRRAIEKGYSLNEYFFTKTSTNEKIMVHSEEELFQILKIPYVLPTDRNI